MLPLAARSLLLDIAVTEDRLVAVGERGHILYSDDRGESWTQARVPTRQMLTAVHFAGPRRGWAVGHDGLILATIDGGETWVVQRDGLVDQQHINHERVQALSRRVSELKKSLLVAGTLGERESLQLELEELELDLEDAQLALAEPVHAPPLLDVYFIDDMRGFAAGAFNTLLATRDGGLSWIDSADRLDNPDEFHLNAIAGDGDGRLWIATERGLLFRSLDAGESWQTLDSPYNASWFGLANSPRAEVLLVFGLRGAVYRSTDGGDSWSRVDVPAQRTISSGVFVGERYALLAGGVGTLLLSDDGGESFEARTAVGRLNLNGIAAIANRVIAVGQGGVHLSEGFGGRP